MKKTNLVLVLAVSISGVSPLLANEVEQQRKQNVEGNIQQGQENETQLEATQTPSNYDVDWTLPGMQLSDWEYEVTDSINVTLKKYIGKPTDTVYVPSVLMPLDSEIDGGKFRYSTIFSGIVLEDTTIENLKIMNLPEDEVNKYVMFDDEFPDGYVNAQNYGGSLKIPDNSVVKNIEFINGNHFNLIFNGSEERAIKNDFTSIKGYDSNAIGLYGNVNKLDNFIPTVTTDLKYVEYIDCGGIYVNGSGTKRINPNPLYLQARNEVSYYDSSTKKYHDITNHYQLNQLLDGMGIKSTMKLKLDANGGNGGVIIQQPVFFVSSLTEEQQKQLYQNKQDLDACIRIAFLENPTYYPTLEGRTFLGWEKQSTNTRAVADTFNQTYLAKWSDPTPVPTVTPTQPQQPVAENKSTPSVNTANSTTAITLATVALAGCVGLITVRRFK